MEQAQESLHYDVAVIGAGLSGLIAARDLLAEGLSVILVEATDRIGGRIRTVRGAEGTDEEGALLEFGATWIGPGQDNMYRLCQELDIEIFPQPVAVLLSQLGKNLQRVGNATSSYEGLMPPLPFLALLDLQQSIMRTDYQSARLDNLTDEEKRALDDISAQAYIDRIMWTECGKLFYAACVRSLCCLEPENISAYDSIIGDMNYCLGSEGGAQQDRISGGVAQIPQKVFEKLVSTYGATEKEIPKKNSRFAYRFSCPIRTVKRMSDGSYQGIGAKRGMEDSNGDNASQEIAFSARACVVAVPPRIVASKLNFEPPLSEKKRRLFADFQSGCITKCVVRYARPWWTMHGFSGQYFADDGVINFMNDHSHAAGNEKNRNNGVDEADPRNFWALVVFVVTKYHANWNDRSLAEREELVCREISVIFGLDDALKPMKYYECNWSEQEYSLGCYSDINNIGFLSRHGGLDVLHNGAEISERNLFFCCSEFAGKWSGYMEGAYISGQAIAQRVIEDYASQDPSAKNCGQ